ncbi:hypothetical protein ACSQ76_00575 [Roseovarius sp. B08]|uniref:hypothetical protein n=1 Tax=Roseovarius sp. B08 TaxID=3449223 RepID=UPI003EDB97E5
MTEKNTHDTTAKLRDDIDRGEGADKVGFPDPAAAPLGTDAEAGGFSPTPEEVRTARQHEIEKRPAGPASPTGPRPVSMNQPARGKKRKWLIPFLLIAFGALVVFAILS